MTTLMLYITLFTWFGQNQAMQYCMEAWYSENIFQAKTKIERQIAIEEAKEKEKVCNMLIKKNSFILKSY